MFRSKLDYVSRSNLEQIYISTNKALILDVSLDLSYSRSRTFPFLLLAKFRRVFKSSFSVDGGTSLLLLAHLEHENCHQDDDSDPDEHGDHDEGGLGLLGMLVLGQDSLSQ